VAKRLATLTPGFSGADLANVCNEGALIAARYDKKLVDLKDLESAIERVSVGLEKKNRILSQQEKKTVAYHEAGHAVVGWFMKHRKPLVKLSIIPRGSGALGYALYQPQDHYLYTKEELFDDMCTTLGGRIAEKIVFGKISTGARDDLEKVTKLAYAQICKYGMNENVGLVSFDDENEKGKFTVTKPYSQRTAKLIDDEARKLVNQAFEIAETLLNEKREALEKVATRLFDKEVLTREDLIELIGNRPDGELVTFDDLVKDSMKTKIDVSPDASAPAAPTLSPA